MSFQDIGKGQRISAALYLIIGISSFVFHINWLDSLLGILTYFFLPGLFLSLLLRLVRTSIVAAIGFGFILSPALNITILYITTKFMGLGLENAETAVTLISLLLAVAVLINPNRAQNSLDKNMPPLDRSFFLGLFFLAFLLTPLLHSGNQLSFHGLFHTSIVHAIQNGFLPPPNPGFYGTPVDTYWHFHLFLAAVVDQANISTLTASAILRVVSLFCSYLLGGLLAHSLIKRPNPWLVAIFAIFCINLAGPILVIADIPGSNRWQDLINGNMSHPTRAVRAILFGEHRTASGIAKYLNFNAFCYTLALWIGSLLITLEKKRPARLHLITFFIIAGAAISFHVPSAPAFLLLLPSAFYLDLFIHDKQSFKNLLPKIVLIFAPFVIALIVWLPYWLPVLSTHNVSSVDQGIANLITRSPDELLANLKLIAGAYWLLLPLLFISPFLGHRLSSAQIKLLVIAFGCLGLSFLFQVLDGNQYKFALLAAVPVGVSVVVILELLPQLPKQVNRIILPLGLILAMLNSSFFTIGHLRSAWWTDTSLTSNGRYLDYQQSDIYAFIRDNTPETAIIIEPLVAIDKSLVGAVGQRASYFRKSTFGYYDDLPDYEQRKTMVKRLLKPGTNKQPYFELLRNTIGTETYLLLIPLYLEDNYEPLFEELNTSNEVQYLFSDAGGAVFKLR